MYRLFLEIKSNPCIRCACCGHDLKCKHILEHGTFQENRPSFIWRSATMCSNLFNALMWLCYAWWSPCGRSHLRLNTESRET